jgi:hypothetical protein
MKSRFRNLYIIVCFDTQYISCVVTVSYLLHQLRTKGLHAEIDIDASGPQLHRAAKLELEDRNECFVGDCDKR